MTIYTKTYLLLMLCLTVCTVPLQARDKHKSRGGTIRFTVQQVTKQNDSLVLELMIYAGNLSVGSLKSLRLNLFLEAGSKQVSLPAVVYTGKHRQGFDKRSELLDPPSRRKEAYRVFSGIDAKVTYPLHYTLSIPYQPWMDHATLRAKEVFHDCCNEYPLKEQVLSADLNLKNEIGETPGEPQPMITDTAVWRADPAVYRRMAVLLTAAPEEVKNRDAGLIAHISYAQGVHKVLPAFGDNSRELQRVDSLFTRIMNNGLIRVDSLHVTGYASVEGSYASNEILARRRSESFTGYLTKKYNLKDYPFHTNWIAEDWQGLAALVETSQMDYKDEVLSIIAGTDIFDGREKKLMLLAGGKPYRHMLERLFPRLRRIEMHIFYTVGQLSDEQAGQLLETRPELLSMQEMCRLAGSYIPGTGDYRLLQVYRIAAKTYPNDSLANNNAAGACLINGDTAEAMLYLDRMGDNPLSFLNRGVWFYITGDTDAAQNCFKKALQVEATREQAKLNLSLINTKNN